MSAEATSLPAAPAVMGRAHLRAAIGSFVGLVPLGIWTTVHLWNNLAAFGGARQWERSVTFHQNPLTDYAGFWALAIFIVWHAFWGIRRTKRGQPNGYPYLGNARWWLQRITAIGLLLFLGAHIWLAKLHPRLVTQQAESFNDLAAHMAHHAPTLIVYLLGIAAIAYHLGNGLWNFAFGFGIVTSQRGMKCATWVTGLVVVALLAVGWLAVFALWHAGQPLPAPAD